jgi:hypothetical protein
MRILDFIKRKQKEEEEKARQAYEAVRGTAEQVGRKAGGLISRLKEGLKNPERTAKKVFMNTTPLGTADRLMNDKKSPAYEYFRPTDKVRKRDVIREAPGATWEALKQLPQQATRFAISAAEAPKAIKTKKATGKYYNTPFGRLNSFQSEAQNRVQRGDPLWKAIGNPALDTVLGAADFASIASPLLGAAKNAKFLPKEARNIAGDLTKLPTKKVLAKGTRTITHEPVEGVFAPGGKQQMRPLETPIKENFTYTNTVPNEYKSNLLKKLSRPGLTIEETKSTPSSAGLRNQPRTTPTTIPEETISPQKNVSSFYNLNRLKISQKAKQGIQDEISNAGKQLEQTVGNKLSNKEVLDMADTSSKILDSTVTREKTSVKIAANLNLRRKIAEVAQSGKIDDKFVDLWMKDKAAGEDIARQLQARKIVADPEEAKTINIVLEAIYKQNKNADEIIKASKGVDFNDAEQVAKLYRNFVKPKADEWLDVLRYNSMLSSPNTHIVNTASNLEGTAVVTPIEKTITGMLDAVKSGFTGKQRQYYAGEGKEYLKGYLSNVGEAASRFVNVMKGEAMNLNPDIRNIPLTKQGTAGRAVENTLSLPMRMLEGMDQFFTALTEGGVKKSLAYRAGKLGKPIADIEKLAKSEATQRLFRATENADQGVILDGIDRLTNTLMRLRNSDNAAVKLMARFTFPFVRTPTNLFKQGIEYSPAGISTLMGAKNKTEQLSKIIIGSSVAAGASMLLGQDRLTWAEPTNAKRKAEFRAAGRQPYSVKVGDKWISYSKLHPAMAFNLALVSALDDSIKNQKLSEDEADTILSTFAKFGNFLVDQSYLRNMGDFLGAVKGDEEKFTSYFANYPQQLIPFKSLMGWITRIIDPVQRKIDTDGTLLEKQMQQVMLNIPGLSENVPAREDQFGAPIPNQNRIFNALSPNRMTTERPEYEQYYQQSIQKSKETSEKAQIKKLFEKGKTQEIDQGDQKKQKYLQQLEDQQAKEDFEFSDKDVMVYKNKIFAKDEYGAIRTIKGAEGLDEKDAEKLLDLDKHGFALTADTLDSYRSLKEIDAMPPARARQIMKELYVEDPKGFKAIISMKSYFNGGIDKSQLEATRVTDGSRAAYIAHQIKKAKSREEAKQMLLQLEQGGYLSKNVLKQLSQIK